VNEAPIAAFTGLVDLAAAGMGGRALHASDDFFAAAENLLQPGRGVFIEGKFTEQGKWMDGWESRRRRANPPDHDWCILALGAAGEVVGFDVDTNHFLGNHPPFASIDGVFAPGVDDLATLAAAPWVELMPQAPLRPGSQNLFAARPNERVTHVRLNIFPDGGVARLRVFGRISPDWTVPEPPRDAETAKHVAAELRDLAAVKNGGSALACSDAFFGPMNNLLLPGRAENMGGGWETRRRRGPGHDWILIKLAARGLAEVVEVDTNHFKGNYPDRFSLDSLDAPAGARITDLLVSPHWSPVLEETKLGPHARHFFAAVADRPATHLRLNVFPDGGISRLRVWGRRP
jgi:allantoicase